MPRLHLYILKAENRTEKKLDAKNPTENCVCNCIQLTIDSSTLQKHIERMKKLNKYWKSIKNSKLFGFCNKYNKYYENVNKAGVSS